MALVDTRYSAGGQWCRNGRGGTTPPYTPPTPNAAMQPGVDYQVGAEPLGGALTTVLPNMAIPGTSLVADSQGSITVTSANTTLRRLFLPTGLVKVKAANCLIDTCIVNGTTSGSANALIDANDPAALGCVITDTSLDATSPGNPATRFGSGVLGHHFTARRVKVRHTTDCFGIFNTSGDKTVQVLLDGVDGDLMILGSPDPAHASDSPISKTHNDVIQVQGAAPGSVIEIRFSRLRGYWDPTKGQASRSSTNKDPVTGGYNAEYPYMQSNSVLQVNQNVTTVSGINMHHNWCYGGQFCIGVHEPDTYTNFGSIVNNKIKFDQNPRTNRQLNVNPAIGGGTLTGNTNMDTGAAVLPKHP